jgi:hypothetical protein
MYKKQINSFFDNLFYSILLLIISIIIIFWKFWKPFKSIITYLQRLRGTDKYEGEDLGTETMNIFVYILLPILFLISFIIVLLIKRFTKTTPTQ